MAKTENPKQRVAKRIKGLANMARKSTIIKEEYYEQHDCKRGLRDLNGKGVVVGLTEISEIIASKVNEQGVREPCNGELYYRGILLDDIVKGFIREKRFGFEEVTYLLLFGKLPNTEELSALVRERTGIDFGTVISMIPVLRGPSGRIVKLEIAGTKKKMVFGKELEIRRILSRSHLYSSAFDIKSGNGRFVLEGKGWGHGVGLCQIGAAVMAAEGAGYKEIVDFYYPGTFIIFAEP